MVAFNDCRKVNKKQLYSAEAKQHQRSAISFELSSKYGKSKIS